MTPSDLARAHGASWAGQLTDDEIRKADAMKMETRDYAADESAGSWRYQTRRKRPVIGSYAWFILAALLTVLASFAVAVVLSKALAKAAAYSVGVHDAW